MPVFMIGTQRSGSNMLRLMLNQLPRFAAPHPPHILSRMAPLVPLYGDLADDAAFAALVDDVCRLVELNAVRWEGVVLSRCAVAAGCRERSIVAIFEAVYDRVAQAWGAEDWICKSMANLNYLPEINRYFPTARYLYLYRDGRDVAASFQKAVVGEKHCYPIALEWHRAQQLALQLRDWIAPGRFFMVSYEQIIGAPEETLKALCAFLETPYTTAMLNFNCSDEARRTAHAGTLWENVTRPVMKREPHGFLNQLGEMDIRIFESVAGPSLDALGYERLFVQPGEELHFSAQEVAGFDAENQRLKAARKASLSPQERILNEHQERLLAAIAARGQTYDRSGHRVSEF